MGIGVDYGYDAPKPVDLENCAKFENITYELLKRGFSEDVIRKIWGENTLRVVSEVEKVAETLQRTELGRERRLAAAAERGPGGATLPAGQNIANIAM